MRVLVLALFLASGCTLTVGHAPESSRVAEVQIRSEIAAQAAKMETIACMDRAADLARALASTKRLLPLKEAKPVDRVLIRNGYKKLARESASWPRPTPSPTPAATPEAAKE